MAFCAFGNAPAVFRKAGFFVNFGVFRKFRLTLCALVAVLGFGSLPGLPASALASEVSVTVDSGFQQREGADVKIKDSTGKEVASGTTAKEGGTGRPKFKTDLPPGTYTIEASWRNAQGRTETGTQTWTVTNGKNEPNVAVAVGGYQNPAGSGTSAAAGMAPAASQANGTGRSGVRLSVAGAYQTHNTNGIHTLPLFDGGQNTGQKLIDEDADTDGFTTELKVGVPVPTFSPGAHRTYVTGRYTHSWSDTTSNRDQIMLPAGQTFEIPGINMLNFVGGFTQLDNLRTESEIDSREGALGLGMKFDFDPFSPGDSPSWGSPSWGSPSPGDDMRRRPINYLAVRAELFGGVREQIDTLTFEQGGNANSIRSDIDTTRLGLRAEMKYNHRVTRDVTVFGGPILGVTRNDSDLEVTQVRGNDTDSAVDSDTSWSLMAGALLGMKFRLPVGMLEARAQVVNDFNSPYTHIAETNDDTTRIDYADDLQFQGGLRYSVNTSQLFASDRRLKRNIERIGTLPSGLPVYRFQYLWSPETHVGVMAQEAMMLFPDAVHEIDGFLAVDYSHIR